MKTLLVLSAVLAAVAAEADPQWLTYGGWGYPSAYLNPWLYPTLKKAEEPAMAEEKAEEDKKVVPLVYSPYYNWGYGLNHFGYNPYYYTYAPYVPAAKEEEKKVEKRDAEADPLTLLYNYHPYTYTHAPLTYTHAPLTYTYPLVYAAHTGCQNEMGAAVPCAYGWPAPAAAPAAEEKKMEKREAEADPEAYWYGNYYNGYAHYPYYNAYASAYYAPYHYAVGGCRNSYGAVVPCA